MKKKLSILLVLVMLIACLSTSVFAVSVGETATVDFTVSNAGYASYRAVLNYDHSALELISFTPGSASVGMGDSNVDADSYAIMDLNQKNVSGTLFTATFKVKDGAAPGTYPVSASLTEAYDADFNNVTFGISGGSVKVDCKHEYGAGVVTAPTCTEQGYTTYTCSKCGNSYKDNYVDATGHSYDAGVVTKEPTCTEEGVKTFTCRACGDTYTEAVPAKGHSYDAGVVTKEPTCTEEGVKTFTCGTCGDTYTEAVPAKGHTEKVVRENEVKGDCKTKHSYDEVVYCSVCGEELSRTKVTGELGGHNYVNGKCTICGKIQDPNLDKQPDTGDIFVEIALYASFAALAVGAVVFAKRKVRG